MSSPWRMMAPSTQSMAPVHTTARAAMNLGIRVRGRLVCGESVWWLKTCDRDVL